jgi:hypothetical protein
MYISVFFGFWLYVFFQNLLTFIVFGNMECRKHFRYWLFILSVLLLDYVKKNTIHALAQLTMKTKGKAKIRASTSKTTVASNEFECVNNVDTCVAIGCRTLEDSIGTTSRQQEDVCVARGFKRKLSHEPLIIEDRHVKRLAAEAVDSYSAEGIECCIHLSSTILGAFC